MVISLRALTVFIFITVLSQSTICKAELLANGNAFLYGDYLEVGIGPDGAFGSNVPSPSGVYKGKLLGYISDPSKTKFKNGYHGDFFLPGYPEEGWGIRVNGKNYNNNSTIAAPEIIGNLSNYQTTATGKRVQWRGEVEGLEITQVYSIYNTGLTIIFDIYLKNTTSTDMQNVYYMRTVDPDNNADQHDEAFEEALDTTNTILYQGDSSLNGASVIATQADGSFLELSGYGQNSRVSFGGKFNRDPSKVFTGSEELKQYGSHTADESIALAYKFPTIKAGESVKFRAGYQLSDLEKPTFNITGNSPNYRQSYQLGDVAIPIVDQDISISASALSQLVGAIIIINNPDNSDKLAIQGDLPLGISIDLTENNNDTQLYLTGKNTIASYKFALQQVVFSNKNRDSSTATRQLTLQILDENYTLSNVSQLMIDITVPITLDNELIANDDIVNAEEQEPIILTGKATENAIINIIFTDTQGQHIIRNTSTDVLGQWSIANHPIDLISLSDGVINIVITASDANGVQTTFSKTIQKDSTILLIDLLPIDNTYLSHPIPVFSGKTDPNALITLELLDGRTYQSNADNKGVWRITLDKFPLGAAIKASINAKDVAGNEISVTRNVKILDLPLTLAPFDTDNNGLSTSTSPFLSGTSQVNANIGIRVAITATHFEICTSITDSQGNWSCQLPVLISGGPYQITVTAKDSEGNNASVEANLSIPKLPLIVTAPVNDAVISDDHPSFRGTSTAGTKITVITSTGKTCSAITDQKNHWYCKLPSLALGTTHNITIQNEDSAGNKVIKTMTIKTNKLPLLIQPLGEKNTAASTRPILIGTSAAETSITITVSTGATCTTTTDSLGNWLCELPKLPVGGPYEVNIKAEDQSGNTTNISQTITIPEIPLLVINPPAGTLIETDSITLSGTSNAGSNITVLGPDGQRCTTLADKDGVWSCQLNDLQTGEAKYITIISGNKLEGEKTVLLPIEIANASGTIKTVTGGGSSSPLLLLFLGLIIFRNISVYSRFH